MATNYIPVIPGNAGFPGITGIILTLYFFSSEPGAMFNR